MEQIFTQTNVTYWVILCLVVWLETKLLTSTKPPYPKKWLGPKRWWLGWLTLFGSSLFMVIFHGWHFQTWTGLAVATIAVRQIKPQTLIVGWQRGCRESHRWTLNYFLAFLLCIPGVAFGPWETSTLIMMFFSLGLCGATKVAWESFYYSLKAEEMRRRSGQIKEVQHGPTC